MAAGQYRGSQFYPAHPNNYTNANRPGSHPINKVIIHVMQGSWSGAINWFQDSRARASAHYNVRSSDGFIGQSVREEDIAYHAGWWAYNKTSIGIEHEGFISDPDWFTDTMYRSSARLSAYLCKKYRIPVDRRHIIGHHEVPGCSGGGGGVSCHTDPGRYWNWDKYIRYIRQYADGSSEGNSYHQIVDNRTAGRFAASSRWISSSYSSQKYGASYRVLEKPLSRSDNARFRIKTPAKDSYGVYARWPADPGYNDRTTFRILTAGGWVNKVVNQRTRGGQWNLLGNYKLESGDSYRIEVSSTSAGHGFIIADAVKIVRK